MIECTALFPDSDWASAHLNGSDLLRINVQYANRIHLVHMRISKIEDFIAAIQREQAGAKDRLDNRV